MEFNMATLLDETKVGYTIYRSSQSIVSGIPVNVDSSFTTYLTVTNAKKEDMDSVGIGNSLGGLLKIRILDKEENQIGIGDKFDFDGDRYEITRKRPYQNGLTDFRIFYAGLEVS
jgi:hypothetical protein